MNDLGKDWKATASGILLPPAPPKEPVVEQAEFAVKVRGFAPEPPIASYEFVGVPPIRSRETMRRTK